MKHIVVLITLLLMSFSLISNMGTTESISTNSLEMMKTKALTANPLFISNWNVNENAAIYFQGWVRYYHYTSRNHLKVPRLFFQNDKFYNQRIPMEKVKKGDKYGDFKIPNKAAFFMVVKNETLSMYTERHDSYMEGVVDGLNLDFIDHVSKRLPGTVGIRDFGEHNLGSCIEITAHIPKSFRLVFRPRAGPQTESVWIICVDKRIDKFKILTVLTKLKRHIQEKRKDHYDVNEDFKEQKREEEKAKQRLLKGLSLKQQKALSFPKDGYWVLLQDWTTCTLKCGGGKSYQQWMCYPPKNGGKPCVGKAIRDKPCNIHPCLSINVLLNKPPVEVLKTTVVAKHFTNRPQRYSPCQTRENDAMLATYDPKLKTDNKRPVRVLMNLKAISIYKDDTYHELFYSYDLKTSQLSLSQKSVCCIIIKDTYKQTKLCGYPENCNYGSNLAGPVIGIGDQTLLNSSNGWAKSWQKDFNLFRTVCKTGRQAVLITKKDLADLPIKDENEGALQDMMKRKLRQEEKEDGVKRIKKTTELGFRAIQKENSLEQMIKDEENQKGKEQLEDLQKKIEEEKKKLGCLNKKIEEKDVDLEDPKKEALKIQQKFQAKIAQKRQGMKMMLERIRRKNRLKRLQMEQELKELKSKISKDLLRANYVGDIQKCIRGKKDLDYRDSYCNNVFVESYITNTDCHSDDLWCEMCCTHEFGNLFIQKRYKCFDACDGVAAAKQAAKKPAEGPGRWLWVSKYQTGGDLMNPKKVTTDK